MDDRAKAGTTMVKGMPLPTEIGRGIWWLVYLRYMEQWMQRVLVSEGREDGDKQI